MIDERILRKPQVMELTGLGKTTLYLLVKSGKFPKPVRIGKRAIGWKYTDVKAWLERLA
jgi:prophage regulatory protein